jgi:monoamine oxidase
MTKSSQGSLTRREALLAGLAGAAGLAATSGCSADATPTPAPRGDGVAPKVLVIGAGAAGLAAAADLHARGIAVTVIEGRDRIGGRVWSHDDFGVTLDLGASWLSGRNGNPVTKIAADLGITTTPTDYEEIHVHDDGGRRIPDAKLLAWRKEYDQLAGRAAKRAGDGALTVEKALERALGGQAITPEEERALAWMVAAYSELPWGVDAAELALRDEPEGFGGGDAVFPDGYVQILAGLAKGVTVRLGEVVRTIEARHDGIRVETSKGVHEADHAIVTLPLGVLKKGSVAFSPPLPARKQGAIDRLAMGALNKIGLVFPHAFWPKEPHFLGYMSARRGELPVFLNLHRALEKPALIAFVTGRYSKQIADLPDQEVEANVMRVLRSMYGPQIPSPTRLIRTHWERDPFAFGSYVHIPRGAERSDMDILAEPVGRLHFAGEATHSVHNGYVHGAILSGRREAQRITR